MTNWQRQQAVWVQSGDPETVDSPALTYPGQLGKFVSVKQPTATAPEGQDEEGRDKVYRLVHTDSSMTVSPFRGAVAWWQDKSRFRTTTSPTNRGRVAGVYQNAITRGNYGWIQTGGPGIVKFVDAPTAAPTAAGLIVIPSGTAGKADCLAAGTAATYPILGYSSAAYNAALAEAVVDLAVPDLP